MPHELNEFGFHGSRKKKQWRVNEEVRSLMDRSLSLLQYSQRGCAGSTVSQQGSGKT